MNQQTDNEANADSRGRKLDDFVAGKIFLGGLDSSTTTDTVMEYVQQWYGVVGCAC